ncbi:hypothetical protein GCM10009745_47620 [Kribbella yunnanensis]|uniref:site-specific DNA-methyltransferase (adenine-specific) n=1 Tax=Kribbella yunnanensis TaxID=190194 RepID=A0ABP4TYT7_9ACTN
MDEPGDRLTPIEIADRVGVRLSAVSNWRSRHADFPQPLEASGQERYDLASMISWLRGRQIPRNRLRPNEAPGTTYGDRLERVPTATVIDSADQAAPVQMMTWQQGLWAAMDSLRGAHDAAASRELLLAFVYVRACHPELWSLFVQLRPGENLETAVGRLGVALGDDRIFLEAINALRITADRAVLEAIDSISKVDLGHEFGPTSPAAELADAVLADLERGMGRAGGQFTPAGVADCLAGLLAPRPDDTVLDPFCVSGELLLAFGATRRYGQPPNDRAMAISTMNLALHGADAELSRPALALDLDQFSSHRFDRIISNPPFNLRWQDPDPASWRYGDPPSSNANFAWLQYMLSKLNPGGRAAAVVAPAAAFSQNSRESAIRRNMIEAGVIECVISLPAQLFRFTAIASMIWILRPEDPSEQSRETLVIDGSELGEPDGPARRRLSPSDVEQIVNEYRSWREDCTEFESTRGFSRVIDIDGFRENDFTLVPARYVVPAQDKVRAAPSAADLAAARAEYQLATSAVGRADAAVNTMLAAFGPDQPNSDRQMLSLGAVSEIVAGPGKATKDGSEPDGVPLVLPRHVSNGRISIDSLSMVSPKTAGRMNRYRLAPGDVVSIRVGTLGRYGRIVDEQTGWLLGPGCVRFRPGPGVDPDFLICYLSGPSALRWVNANASGSAVQHLSAATLGRMPIWLPPLNVQRQISRTLAVVSGAVSAHEQAKVAAGNLQDLLNEMLLPR